MNSEILPGVHLLEIQAPQLARAAQPGQYCMLRGCDSLASDPLLLRPFFIAEVQPERDVCRFFIHKRGRASTWLARQQPGMSLDLLGPLGHGWTIRPEVRNLLLIGEDPLLASLIFLASHAIEQELSVTLIHCVSGEQQGTSLPIVREKARSSGLHKRKTESTSLPLVPNRNVEGYPPALLPPEVEYQVFAGGETLAAQIGEYLTWADAVCCSLSESTLAALARGNARWREKHFVQAVGGRPLACVTGTCLACRIETRHGSRLVCRDGPVFALHELLEDG